MPSKLLLAVSLLVCSFRLSLACLGIQSCPNQETGVSPLASGFAVNLCPWLRKEMKPSGRNTSSTFMLQKPHSPLEKTGMKRRKNRAIQGQVWDARQVPWLWNPEQAMALWVVQVFRKQSKNFQDPEALKCVWTHTESRTLYSWLWSQACTTHVHTQEAHEFLALLFWFYEKGSRGFSCYVEEITSNTQSKTEQNKPIHGWKMHSIWNWSFLFTLRISGDLENFLERRSPPRSQFYLIV